MDTNNPSPDLKKWILFFPMGSELGRYFCCLQAPGIDEAIGLAWKYYPLHILRIVPDDDRARANIRVYGKQEIKFGHVVKVVAPDEALGGD